MKQLKALLANYAGTIKMGKPTLEIDMKKLQSDLNTISKDNCVYFNICVGMLLILFISSLAIVFMFIPNTQLLAGIFSVLGISVIGVITKMISLWREKSHVDLLYILAGTLKEDIIKSILQILVKKF